MDAWSVNCALFTVLVKFTGEFTVMNGASQFFPLMIIVFVLVPHPVVEVNTIVFIPAVKVRGATSWPLLKFKLVIDNPLWIKINSEAELTFCVTAWKVKLPVFSVWFVFAGLVMVTVGAIQGA